MMNFSALEFWHNKWRGLLVIGRTIEYNGQKSHIIGMTLAEEARLYILEPYRETEPYHQKRARSHRSILKEHETNEVRYLNCCSFSLGETRFEVTGGSGGSLKYSLENYGDIQVFLDMLSAGWTIPEWLKNLDWEDLQLVTVKLAGVKKLPRYTPGMPVTILHRPDRIRHILEKTITLHVGKSRTFSFSDHIGDKVRCYIDEVSLIDVWKNMEEDFSDPKHTQGITPEELQKAKNRCFQALQQDCPKEMCHIGIAYECSKDIQLEFYTKEYLRSLPAAHTGGSCGIIMLLYKSDQKTGPHGLPMKTCVIQTAVPPDTTQISAELFSYYEEVAAWEEHV